jgi:hypothetical protein
MNPLHQGGQTGSVASAGRDTDQCEAKAVQRPRFWLMGPREVSACGFLL